MHALATSHGPLATGGDSLAAILRWDGSQSRTVVDSIPGRLSWPLSDGKNLYFCVGHRYTTRTEMMRWDGRSLVTLPRYAITYFKHAVLFDGEPYVFGNDSTGADVVFRYDGATWRPVSAIWSGASTLEYNGQFYAGGCLMPGCVPYASSFVRLCRQPECGMISGRVYNDADGNCARSPGDASLAAQTHTTLDLTGLPAGVYLVSTTPRDGARAEGRPVVER